MKKIEDLKKEGKTIVTCNGSFDILHIGHIKFLQEAKKQGDVLIVGLNSDSSIKQYKSPNRPINTQEDRKAFLLALKPVDDVVIFNEPDPLEFLRSIKPNVHCNGEEYGEDCLEAPLLKELGTKLHIIKKVGNFSTTNMIKQMKQSS